jgi:hypothetical protein
VKRDEASGPDRAGNDSLDRILQEASWPEPEPERLERLWRQWLLLPRVRTRSFGLALASAAALLLALTGGLVWAWIEKQTRLAQIPLEPIEDVPPLAPRVDYLVESRSPTPYETIVMVAAEQRRRVEKKSISPPSEPSPVGKAIAKLMEDPSAEPLEIVESIVRSGELKTGQLEVELDSFIRGHIGTNQLAAIRLLAPTATRRSLPLLRHLSSKPETHAAAMVGLARFVDPPGLAQLAAAESDPHVKSHLLSELLRRNGHPAVTLFLNFVVDRGSFDVAMEAVDSVADPPVETLFQMLESSNYPLRIAAARVLGRLDGPVISHRLAEMVVRDTNRREALIALLSCPSEDAAQFLASAERNTGLASNIRAARFQLHALQ